MYCFPEANNEDHPYPLDFEAALVRHKEWEEKFARAQGLTPDQWKAYDDKQRRLTGPGDPPSTKISLTEEELLEDLV